VHLGDVADEGVGGFGEVGEVGLLRVGIPLACKYAASAVRLEAHADAADAGEKVDEGEGCVRRVGRSSQRQQALADRVGQVGRMIGFAKLPTADCAGVYLKTFGQFLLRVAAAQ